MPSSPRFDVLGIGNAIVDVIGACTPETLARHGSAKGSMQLVDLETVRRLEAELAVPKQISGGSVANTTVGVASFGGRSAFIGKTARDPVGEAFAHDIRAAGVHFTTAPAAAGSLPSGRSLILVTPDGERTMHTYLGVSPELDHGEVDAGLIADARIVLLEGYLFDRPPAKAAFHQTADIARSAGRQVALTLSDRFCVDRHRAEFLDLVRARVDILFANESEITALYQVETFEEAATRISADTRLAVLTRSEKGSLICAGAERIAVPAAPVAAVVDVTGAGDLYAAGFLFGVATGRDLATAGRLGSLAAAEVISHLGARPLVSLRGLAERQKII